MRVIRDAFQAQLQLQNEIVASCRQSLEKGRQRRANINNVEQWLRFKEEKLGVIRRVFPEILFKKNKVLNST